MVIEFKSRSIDPSLQVTVNGKYYGVLAFRGKVWTLYITNGKRFDYTNNLTITEKLIAKQLNATEIIYKD
ncbi:transcriptional regulator [Lactobacillus gasseri]|jgi:hypothetical protein|uniref:hypothetical protein n=1 Tax=Lactobacillus TaxID=1578 RepID=UPI00034215E1|nr:MULTISPECIES: hypothetical protein [Lactobacillus]KDA99146.1 Trp operon repressor [Lactobacillus paragasseri K7]MDK7211202.1 transcriptional regulator [Lactobacillus gasseri]MDK8141275.1 transcriptional regulator [Lactobacillus gasseri]MDK8391350.1 transcriptional regulator [Lactobacillus gasseri]MDT9589178.1 transcriptional regulator [Lactobacillus paragasseri]